MISHTNFGYAILVLHCGNNGEFRARYLRQLCVCKGDGVVDPTSSFAGVQMAWIAGA